MHENHLKHIASICQQKKLTCQMHLANRGDYVPLNPLNISRYGEVDYIIASSPRMPSFSANTSREFTTKVTEFMGKDFLNNVTSYKPSKRS